MPADLMGALGAAKLGLAPALSNLNFDFTMCKIEAPPEFQGIGRALSTARRKDAEIGRLHVLARKLGALFERDLPDTPSLFKAYGERASEIASSKSLDEKARKKYGVFASQAGLDASSLWAAATSGKGALGVHLLACMLARIWDESEATSIWVQIIECKKQKLQSEMEQTNSLDMTSYFAAQQQYEREQIREWDASARAWLHTADTAMEKRQKQLMLIIGHLELPVNRRPDTFESVMDAWKNSLLQMEMLVKGISLTASQGDILLALSSWHLYPDLSVLQPSVKDVHQADPLIQTGGILTIGMGTSRQDHQGLHWSLPLSHLRHYGEAIVVNRSVEIARSRTSLHEFGYAILGCFLSAWAEAAHDVHLTIRWLASLQVILENPSLSIANRLMRDEKKISWLRILLSTATRYENCKDTERARANQLLLLGQKHGKKFLGLARRPLFGLIHHGTFVKVLRSEDDRVAMLREVAASLTTSLGADPESFIIRYRHRDQFEFASALPCITDQGSTSSGVAPSRHFRYSLAHRKRLPPPTKVYMDALGLVARGLLISRTFGPHIETKTVNFEAHKVFFESIGEEVFKRENIWIDDLMPRHCLGIHATVHSPSIPVR